MRRSLFVALVIALAAATFAQVVPTGPLHLGLRDVTGEQWVWLAVLVLCSDLLGHVGSWVLAALLRLRDRKKQSGLSDKSDKALRWALGWVVGGGFFVLMLEQIELPPRLFAALANLGYGVVAFGAIWVAAGVWDLVCDSVSFRTGALNERAENLLIPITRKMVKALIVSGGILLTIALYGVNVTAVLGGLGIGGLLLALAAKDSVENIFGSLTILFDMPFSVGDWVKVSGVEGIVEQVNLRSTRIRAFDDSLVTLPNANLIKTMVENYGCRHFHRHKLVVKLAYPDNPSLLVDLRTRVLASLAEVEELRAPSIVLYDEATDLGVPLIAYVFVNEHGFERELEIRTLALAKVLGAVGEIGLDFPKRGEP